MTAEGHPDPDQTSGLRAPLWRAIAVYRLAALVYVAALVVANVATYARPVLGWAALALMAGWTALISYLYALPVRRRWALVTTDFLVTVGFLLASVPVIGRGALDTGAPTLTIAWYVSPVLAWSVAGGKRRGVVAALVMGAAEFAVRQKYNQGALTGTILMLLAAIAVGHLVKLVDVAERRLQRAIELEAATRERERLARHFHESVLQVLALVKRRGETLDGEAGELARLAGEQEVALRTLLSSPPPAPGGPADVRALLAAYRSELVTVSGPAEPVPLPAAAATELAAAVGAALDNVAAHAGPAARAWVLVEDLGDAVVVGVRDDGPGIPPGRLAAAAEQGRLGVAASMRGRMAELGGTMSVHTGPGEGTEVEFRVPRGGR